MGRAIQSHPSVHPGSEVVVVVEVVLQSQVVVVVGSEVVVVVRWEHSGVG